MLVRSCAAALSSGSCIHLTLMCRHSSHARVFVAGRPACRISAVFVRVDQACVISSPAGAAVRLKPHFCVRRRRGRASITLLVAKAEAAQLTDKLRRALAKHGAAAKEEGPASCEAGGGFQ